MTGVESKKTICLAIGNFGGPVSSDTIGTHYDQIAKLLSKNDWEVIILSDSLAGEKTDSFPERYFKETGIHVYDANQLYRENTESPDDIWRDSNRHHARSHVFDAALQVLIKKYRYKFDLVEFPESEAGGFIPIRAKYSRICDDTRVIVKLHGPSQWQRENRRLEGVTIDDLKLDYMERYAFENADIQVSSSQYLLRWAQEHGWKVSADVSVCLNPVTGLNQFNSPGMTRVNAKQDRIVFSGRFAVGKEVNEFIRAMNYAAGQAVTLPKQYKITFLRTEEQQSISYVRDRLPEFEVDFLNLARKEELTYLIEQARLVVAPASGENYPDTVLECICARIPLITSRDGGIPEILGAGSNLYESISCDSGKPEILGNCILKCLSYNREQQDELLESAYQRLGNVADPEQIVSWYNTKLREGRAEGKPKKGLKNGPPAQEATVTVIIPYYNAQKYILSTLEAIYQQTYKNFKIVCVNDGSTDPDAVLMLDNIRLRYPEVLILDKENGGPGSALNYALPHITGKYIIEVDADNIIKPNMLKTYVDCMENRQDLAALSCYLRSFQDNDETQVIECLNSSKEFTSGSYYKALGPCLPVLFFENCAGDANSIFTTEALIAIGGWPETREGFQDWGLWIKLLANGYRLDVVPEVLFYYRQHALNDVKTKTASGLDKANFELIHSFIEKNSWLFSSSCYEGLHRLVRGSQTEEARIKDARIKDLESQIDQMNHGIAMSLTRRYRRVVDKLLPAGTRRRNLYRFGSRSVSVILNEGLRGFSSKAIKYVRKRRLQNGAVPVD